MLNLNWTKIRSIFGGSITQTQVDGINTILSTINSHNVTDNRQAAYIFATVFHETARTMQPIKEEGSVSYFTKMYDIQGNRPTIAKQLGNTTPGDGAKYFGRGFVQITGKINYQRFSLITGKDLVSNPDEALDSTVASIIMIEGMEKGMFTGVGLSKYISGNKKDYINARRIINGLDRAELIAGYANNFESCIINS